MIKTTEISPSAQMSNYVRCYRERTFNTNKKELIIPWSASSEMIFNFNLKDLPKKLINPATGQILEKAGYGGILGRGTQYNGKMILQGDYRIFDIVFKPNGFYKLFRIPSRYFNNYIVHFTDVFNNDVNFFVEILLSATTLTEMAAMAENFLLRQRKKTTGEDLIDPITAASNMIVSSKGQLGIDGLAGMANMSIRNFQRRFIEQVGVSPKMLSCLARFNHALQLRLSRREMSWMSIIHESGYYDQMHLIKDFKRFAGAPPSIFVDSTPLANESFLSRVNTA